MCITDVQCKRGKYDAIVYFDVSGFTKEEIEKRTILLNVASGKITSLCLAFTSWYKCPKFKFIGDKTVEKSRNIQALFSKINKPTED